MVRSLGQPGLGNSPGQFSMNMGNNGMGMGMGGMMAGMTGQRGGGTAMRGPQPFMPSTRSIDGTGGSKKMQHANHVTGAPAGFSAQEIEVVKSAANAPRKAGDRDGGSSAEYRKLVSEYFRSVAEHP